MKAMKKLTALLLCAACIGPLLALQPAGAAGAASAFSDVTDPDVGQAVEVLRMMGIVDGVSADRYAPERSLTRAQFCKLAVLMLGRGDEAEAYASQTIFPDVASGHWARGFVNLAARTSVGGEEGDRLILGVGDGTFAPDRAIDYAQAVTIVLRMLGYSAEANTNWPSGAMSTAASIGLTKGITGLETRGTIGRGQAAILFHNMLSAPVKGSERAYVSGLGRVEEDLLLLSCDAVDEEGRSGVELFSAEDGSRRFVRPALHAPSGFLQGQRGSAVLDGDGRLLTFLPDGGSSKTIVTAGATAGSTCVITASDGTKISLSPSTTVWYKGTKQTYSEVYASLDRAGVTVLVCYTAAGAVDYLYVSSTNIITTAHVLAVKEAVAGDPFVELTGGAHCTILKNGVPATIADVRQFDVGAYDAAAKILYVTDFRLTGTYQEAAPNTAAPARIKVFGRWLDVLEPAIDDLKQFKLGSSVTLLFAPDGKVAGAVAPSSARSNAVGVVKESSGGEARVELLGAPTEELSTISGKFSGKVENYQGSLVSVSSAANGSLSLSRLTSQNNKDAVDLRARTVGEAKLRENVGVYERVGTGAISPISLADITVDTVPASKVVYARRDYAGQVDLLVLDDVTGDQYVYGKAESGEQIGYGGSLSYANRTLTVINGEEGPFLTTICSTYYKDGQFIGLAASLNELDGLPRTAGAVALKSVSGAGRDDFDLEAGRFSSGTLELPIWSGVRCYNAATKTWFTANQDNMKDLNACLSYSRDLTVYYDRDPSQGGKVRIVVAN